MRKLAPIYLPLLLLALLPGSATAATAPQHFIGIAPQSAAEEADYRLMERAEIDTVRLPLVWAMIQSDVPLVIQPDWSGFDRAVRLAAEHELRVFPFLWGSPDWVAAHPSSEPVETAWQRWAWASFLREPVGRYGPEGEFWAEHPVLIRQPIRRWEIWNEQNIVTFAHRPNPERFAKLIQLSGRVLHRVDPGSKVILGGLFGRPLQIPPNIASGEYLSRIYQTQRVKPFFDGIALHPYVADAGAMRSQIVNLRRIMRIHGDAETPLYVTELGWGSDSFESRWERGPYGQAREPNLAFSMRANQRKRWRIGGVWWFSWADEVGACQFCDSAGLLTKSREAKPSWYRFNAWTGGEADTVPRASLAEQGPAAGQAIGSARLRSDFDHNPVRPRRRPRWLSRFPTFPTPTTRSSPTSTRRRCASITTSTTRPTSTKPTKRWTGPSGPTATSRTSWATSPACPATSRPRFATTPAATTTTRCSGRCSAPTAAVSRAAS